MINSKTISKVLVSEPKTEISGFVQKHRLTSLLPNIARRLARESQSQKSSQTLFVRTSKVEEFNQNAEKLVRKKLEAKDVPINIVEDRNLAAGFVAEYKGKLLDGSAHYQLLKLKSSIKNS